MELGEANTPEKVISRLEKYVIEQENVNKTDYLIKLTDLPAIQKNQSNRRLSKGNSKDYIERDTDDGKIFGCTYCEYTSKSKYNVQEHTRCRHEGLPLSFECFYCGYKAGRKIQIARHIRSQHVKSDVTHNCPHCSYSSHLIEYIRKHVRYNHEDNAKMFDCTECDFKTKWKNNLKKHVKNRHVNAKSKILKCTMCSFETEKRRTFNRHVKGKHIQSEEELFRCPHCEFRTTLIDYLRRHIKYKHDETVDTHKCHLCSYTSKRKGDVKNHVEVVHEKTEVKAAQVLECPKCEYRTVRRKTLLGHLKLHDANRIFRCEHCPYESKIKCNLQKHIMYRHSEDDKSIFYCGHCPYTTKWKEGLTKHIRYRHIKTEKDCLKCPHCKDYKTLYERTLNRHIRGKHSETKETYECSRCNYRTNLAEYLRKHIKNQHDIDVLFRCSYCKFKTKTKCNLSKHLKRKHGKEHLDEKEDIVRIKVSGVPPEMMRKQMPKRTSHFEFVEVGAEQDCESNSGFKGSEINVKEENKDFPVIDSSIEQCVIKSEIKDEIDY